MSGASQAKIIAVPLSVNTRFLGGPIVFTIGADCEVNADAGIMSIDPD